MKKILKFSLALILIFSILMVLLEVPSNADYASEMAGLIKKDYQDSTNTTGKVNTITGTIITSIRIIGVAIAIVMLLTLAMKYMTAAPGDKADIKKSAIQYVVGALVLFGAVGILDIISKFAVGIK